MTTPQPAEFDGGGSRLLGGNGLQQAIDSLTQAVQSNTQAVQQSAANAPGGTTMPFGSTGQSFTFGSFPKMSSMAPANQPSNGGYSGSNVIAPMGGGSGGPQTLGQMASQSMANGFSSMGSQFGTRVMMNQFASMSTLGMGPGNLGQQMSSMYNQAFGSYGSNVNAIALNAADAAQGYSTLQGIAGAPNVMSNSLGRAAYSAYSGLGIANPSLGSAQSAAAIQQLYSPMTSMLMRRYGYQSTPQALGGVGNPLQGAQLAQSIFQRWFGSGSVSMSKLNYNLANGRMGQVNLQALGLDPGTYGPMLQMYDKLFQQGVGANQANSMLTAASKNQNYNGESAQKLLSNKYGINTSDLQKMKDVTATQTSNQAGEMGGFEAALSAGTTAVKQFETAIGHFLQATGLGKLAGIGAGASGVSGMGGMLGNLLGSGMSFGLGMLSKFGGAGGSGGAGGGASAGGTGTPGSSNTSMSRQVSTAIKDAESMIGRPYVWGGDNPAVGFDCSGLIEWAYAQAGIKLPRTSQEQWAALQNRSVPLGKVRAGDIVFSAGSDGTASSPGHEAMMISNNQIIESPYTGAAIRIRSYDPSEWQHAGRPTGSMTGGGFTTGINGNSAPSTTTGAGNGGLGLAVGNYGSSSELQNVSAALLGSGLTGISGTFGATSTGNGQGSGSVSTPNVNAPANASAAQAQSIARQLAAAYGWGSGTQWNDLVQLWNDESGWRWNATNPQSGAYGIPQALPGSKMASAGADWRTNAATQEKWGLAYIKGRYGSPAGALAHENSAHWYADGTASAAPGLALVGERGPELVSLSGGQQIASASRTKNILKGQAALPGTGQFTTAQLMLAPLPQNGYARAGSGRYEVNLNLPPNAINIHTQGSATDVSNAVRQIMEGISNAMAENETVRQIMDGVMG